MQGLVEEVEWWWLLNRASADPAKFIERAAWHLFEARSFVDERAGMLLFTAARFAAQGAEVPAWLFR
jgi:hypothetical protein